MPEVGCCSARLLDEPRHDGDPGRLGDDDEGEPGRAAGVAVVRRGSVASASVIGPPRAVSAVRHGPSSRTLRAVEPGAPGASRIVGRVPAARDDDDLARPARSIRRSWATNGTGSRAVRTMTVVPGRRPSGRTRAAARTAPRRATTAARGGPGRARPGRAPPRPASARTASRRPCSRPRQTRTARSAPSERAIDAATTYSASTASSSKATSQAGPSAVWTSSAIEHLPVARRLEPLEHGWPSRALVRGWIAPDGIARRVRPDAGEPGRILDRPWRARSTPPHRSVGASSGGGDGPRPDEERVDVVALLDRRPPGERVADARARPARARRRRADRPDVEPAHDALERRSVQTLRSTPASPRPSTRSRSRTSTPGARVVVGPQPGERQAPPVPDLDRERDRRRPTSVGRAPSGGGSGRRARPLRAQT